MTPQAMRLAVVTVCHHAATTLADALVFDAPAQAVKAHWN